MAPKQMQELCRPSPAAPFWRLPGRGWRGHCVRRPVDDAVSAAEAVVEVGPDADVVGDWKDRSPFRKGAGRWEE